MTEQTETTAATPEVAKPSPPKFADNGRPRFRTVPLEWPIEYDGKTYSEITVRRMTTAEVVAFLEQSEVEDGKPIFPMFDVPSEVINALDPDDDVTLGKAVNDFLPRALRPVE